MKRVFVAASALAALAGLALSGGATVSAEKDEAYAVRVENASGKVGERAVVMATVTTKDGYDFAQSYRNRIIELSALDGAVEFERRVVRGAFRDGRMVFKVGVTPKMTGTHPINGVFRIGFHNGEQLNMISVPLIATVTGTE
jgi:hypothetical protein